MAPPADFLASWPRPLMAGSMSASADPGLTPREREIVLLAGKGLTNAQIAAELSLSPGTVKKHLENVYGKLGVGNRAAAANMVRSQRTAG